jgi:hypothetical protein
MNACPVCEAPAMARVCDVCGHAFAEASAPEAPVARLPDLDVPPTPEGPTPVVPFPDLEPTRFPTAAIPAAGSDVEWERNSMALVADVAAGGLADLDTGREVTAPERTPPTLVSVTCRYCRNVQASGLMCERCGMRLPWSPRVVSSVLPPLDPDVLIRCQRCGERTYQRERCSSCGGLLTSAS